MIEGRAAMTTAGAGPYPQLNVQAAIRIFPSRRTPWQGWVWPRGSNPGRRSSPSPAVVLICGTGQPTFGGIGLLGSNPSRDGSGVRRCAGHRTGRPCRCPHTDRGRGQSYFRIRELDEQIEIAQRALALRRDSLDIIRKRTSVGLASDLDVKRTEVLVAGKRGANSGFDPPTYG